MFEDIISRSAGAFIRKIRVIADEDQDLIEIALSGPMAKDGVAISMRKVHFLRIDKPPDLAASFVDRIEIVQLSPEDSDWPAEVERMIVRFATLPSLFWFRMVGPVGMDVLAESMSTHLVDTKA